MSELEYCAFCDGGYAHSGICDKCATEIEQTGKELADKDKQLAEARAENNVLKAALWHYGNRMGPNIVEELKDGLPERLWRKINLKEVEETDGEEI